MDRDLPPAEGGEVTQRPPLAVRTLEEASLHAMRHPLPTSRRAQNPVTISPPVRAVLYRRLRAPRPSMCPHPVPPSAMGMQVSFLSPLSTPLPQHLVLVQQVQ